MSAKLKQLEDILQPVVEGLGYEFWGIEFRSQGHHSLLRVFIDDAENGIGIWSEPDHGTAHPVDREAFDKLLDRIGYGWPASDQDQTKKNDDRIKRAIAFQRHWRPQNISGVLDGQCMSIAAALANMIGK